MPLTIYHNPRCRKSREALSILLESGTNVNVVEYLKTPLSFDELKSIVKKLGIKASELVRKGEEEYKNRFKGKDFTEDQWINAMVESPILIERPIVVNGDKAVIGRPPESVRSLI